jgi:hypothetical protein
MDDLTEEERRRADALLAEFFNGRREACVCPRCGAELESRGGMHCSGRDEEGRRWTGGVDWAFCQPCQRWFNMVHGPNHPPPRSWEPCEPPPDPTTDLLDENGPA